MRSSPSRPRLLRPAGVAFRALQARGGGRHAHALTRVALATRAGSKLTRGCWPSTGAGWPLATSSRETVDLARTTMRNRAVQPSGAILHMALHYARQGKRVL